MTDHAIDASAVEVGTEVAHVEHGHAPATLFRTDDPVVVVERATRVADALRTVLDRQGLTANISGKRHVLVEGWTTLGAMVGVTAVPVWTHPLAGDAPGGKSFGFEARVEARTLDGRVIGAAEAMCTRDESRWRNADDYAIKSMAQTRATSKALRGPLGFVVTLAGYEATPSDEIPTPAPSEPAAATCTPEQYQQILAAFAKAQERGLEFDAFIAHLDEIGAPASEVIGERIVRVPTSAAAELLGWLMSFQVQTGGEGAAS